MGCFSGLPEECISTILSLTTPRDACRFSSISWEFKVAADSDAVWERFLPSDYRDIISGFVSPVVFTSKRDLYFRLCHAPFLLSGGTKSFMLDKPSGKKCYMLGARELSIAWVEFPYVRNWTSQPQPRFSEVAYLWNGLSLDIQGKIESRLLSPSTTYAAYLVFTIAGQFYGLEDPPIKASVKLLEDGVESETESDYNTVYLQSQISTDIPKQEGQLPCERGDGWMEIEMGQFLINERGDGVVEMRLMEFDAPKPKSGLVVEGIELRPKHG
ncbi:hypothetical protein F0562_000134 [Nyssa sinensis]|uniref:F-box domain-containing protein n=1 Tax=Nyssa sinensis TaxID=561372 RepID=A0A5J5C2T7_9ASTE|nr:hypothetical protein F0562_000134 [Nyssa sinensis]